MDETLWGMPLELAVGLISGLGGALVGGAISTVATIWATNRQQAAISTQRQEDLQQARLESLERTMAELNAAAQTLRIATGRAGGGVDPDHARDLFVALSVAASQAARCRQRALLDLLGEALVAVQRVIRALDKPSSQEELRLSSRTIAGIVVLTMHWLADPDELEEAPRTFADFVPEEGA